MKKIFLTFSAMALLLSCNSNKSETEQKPVTNKNQEKVCYKLVNGEASKLLKKTDSNSK
ncbi:MAG: hypothetical protein HXM47_01290 [Pseudoleptotrichia goodfellowii]|nr:hypothetical protein [Pseudoleptotrichia goodfellowii]